MNPDKRYNMAPFTWKAGTRGRRIIRITGLKIRLDGEINHESDKTWRPAVLFELKPPGCTRNLSVTGADLGGLTEGLRRTEGTVEIRPTR